MSSLSEDSDQCASTGSESLQVALEAIRERSPILDFAGRLLGDRDAVRIGTALWEDEHVKMLDMSHNSVACEGAAAFGRVLRTSRVQVLDLSHNRIEDRGASELSAGLGGCTTLAELDVSFNRITQDGVGHVTRAMASVTAVRSLCIGGNLADIEGGAELGRMLAANSRLKVLHAFGMRLGCRGAAQIASALCCPGAALKELNLNRNGIGDEGARALSQMLRRNTSLNDLMLEHNRFREPGHLDVADSLLENGSLETLLLEGNLQSPASIARFAHVLERNDVIRRLRISADVVPDDVAAVLRMAMARRRQQDAELQRRMAKATQLERLGGELTLAPDCPRKEAPPMQEAASVTTEDTDELNRSVIPAEVLAASRQRAFELDFFEYRRVPL